MSLARQSLPGPLAQSDTLEAEHLTLPRQDVTGSVGYRSGGSDEDARVPRVRVRNQRIAPWSSYTTRGRSPELGGGAEGSADDRDAFGQQMNLVISNATVFTGVGPLLRQTDVLVVDDRIAAIGRRLPLDPSAVNLDGQGSFVTAGLIDVHTHLALVKVPERAEPHPDTPFLAARGAREKLASGVTTVRDLGGINHVDLALRRAIARGDVPGPRMVAAGKVIAATGGHISYWAREADGATEVRRAVREQIKAGADVIKLMLSGGGANVGERPDLMQLQPDEIREAVMTATEGGRRVACHVHPSRGIRIAAEAGVVSVEHTLGLDDAAIEAVLKHSVWVVPTQAVYARIAANVDGWPEAKAELSRRILDAKTLTLQQAIASGVKIGVGSDSGRHFPHDEIAAEMLALEEAGMTREQVLLAATKGNAELIGMLPEIGTIEVGKRADLVLFRSDPMADLDAIRGVRYVIRGGVVFEPSALLSGSVGRFLARGPAV